MEAARDLVVREILERQDAEKGAAWLTLIDRDAKTDRAVLHARLGAQARRDQIVEDTRDNALILSRAAERNVEPVLPLFRWFSQSIQHLDAGAESPPDWGALAAIARRADEDSQLLRLLTTLVRDADTGITGMGTEAVPSPVSGWFGPKSDELAPETKDAMAAFGEAFKRLANTFERQQGHPDQPGPQQGKAPLRFFTEHRNADGSPARFSLRDESAGTLEYLHLVGLLLQHCRSADLLVVDELHASLHPQLARRVIEMAHSPAFGTAGAQLLFTTHDTTLLDPELLRRDQIFLTQKGPDGAAELYSLWDFENMPRNTAAWARNYLAGRFGGVPMFGPALADIPQADKPTPVQRTAGEPVESG